LRLAQNAAYNSPPPSKHHLGELAPRELSRLWDWRRFNIAFLSCGFAALKPLFISLIIGFSFSSLIVLYATRGKHPRWIVLLVIAVLTGAWDEGLGDKAAIV